MAQYVNIMTDHGFKAVFQDKLVTMNFLNAALAGERVIKDLTYLDKEIQPESQHNRTVIFDLLCEEPDGTRFILEMQNCPQSYFFNRGFYYLCRMVTRQGKIGSEWGYELLPVYGIYFLNFKLSGASDYRTDVILANEKTGEAFSEIRFKQIYISFPLFNLREEECQNSFDRWIFILKNMDIFEQSPFKEEREAFRRLLDVANLNALSEQERAVYEENLKNYRDWYATINYAAKDGERKGIEKGKIEVARNLKAQGVEFSVISRSTGLAIQEIEKL